MNYAYRKFLRGYNYNRRYKLGHLTPFLPRNAMHRVDYAVGVCSSVWSCL